MVQTAYAIGGARNSQLPTLNCLLNNIEFGMMPEDAVTAPRFSTGHHQDSFNPDPDRKQTLVELQSLTLNSPINEDVRKELTGRGHKINTTSNAIANPVMIFRDPDTGMIYAAGDPKARRHAGALSNTSP